MLSIKQNKTLNLLMKFLMINVYFNLRELYTRKNVASEVDQNWCTSFECILVQVTEYQTYTGPHRSFLFFSSY